MASCVPLAVVPAKRRIGGSYATLSYAGGTLMDVMAFFTAAGQAIGLIRTAAQTLDEAKIVSATNELNAQLMHLGAEVFRIQKEGLESTERERAALTRIHDLEGQVRKLEQRLADRERYELVEDHPGTLTLRLKEACRNGEPVHHLCPGCMDNKAVKSILQSDNPMHTRYKCPNCQTLYRMADTPTRPSRAIMD